jgi:protein phosphatase
MQKAIDNRIIFLGDYGDRGAQSPELYYCILRLKQEFQKQIILLRGNHEGPTDLMAIPHDLPKMLQRKFKEKWVPIYSKLRELFDHLYNAAYVCGKYLLLHGGLPARIRSLQELAEADNLHPEKTYLEELLWNDPDEEVKGILPSPRGAGNLFGKAITQEVLDRLHAKMLIRGHEVANQGFKINHDGKILTLFSCKGEPYFTTQGAYLDLPLSETAENAYQLLPFIHTF